MYLFAWSESGALSTDELKFIILPSYKHLIKNVIAIRINNYYEFFFKQWMKN